MHHSPAKSPPSKDTVQLMTLKQLYFWVWFLANPELNAFAMPKDSPYFHLKPIFLSFTLIITFIHLKYLLACQYHQTHFWQVVLYLNLRILSHTLFCNLLAIPCKLQINLPLTISAMYQGFMTILGFDENRLTYISLCLFVAHRCS